MMINLASKLKFAKLEGEKVVRDCKITALPIDPTAIAHHHGILVHRNDEAAWGVSGMLIKSGDAFGIMYATHIPSEGFQRFSVAHELGHYFLSGHPEKLLATGVHQSMAGFASTDPYEQEADCFASGLLMPGFLVSPLINKMDDSLKSIRRLAETCGTSLTATAIRYVELSRSAVAVIISSGNTINYAILSDAMKSLPRLTFLKRDSAVPPSTCTHAFNKDSERVLKADIDQAEIDIQDWLGGNKSFHATEEVIGLGRYGRTLTFLNCPALTDEDMIDGDDDEEDEQKIIDRWTPRFR